ncbi:hypothetical protein [Bacillus toyonensis]|nr:hypothetical protein [Bacillus toyonensis]
MNVFTDHGDYGGTPIKDFLLNSHGNGGGSKLAHGDAGGSQLKEHGKGI